MNFEWDEHKRISNEALHGLDFADVHQLEWNFALTFDQVRKGELRHLTYATIEDQLFAVVWMQRNSVIRIISFRKANRREIIAYEKAQTAQS